VLVGTLDHEVVDLVSTGPRVPAVAELTRSGPESIPKLTVLGAQMRKGLGSMNGELLERCARTRLGDVARFLDGVFEFLSEYGGEASHGVSVS
jgi:hypothetical protein